jgi:drug/metabolite transporter (DMT)-like permease
MFNILFLSIGATTLALFALYYIIEKQGAVKATYINFIMPILSMIISTLFEGFKWNVLAFIGMLTVLLSVFIGIKRKKSV